MNTTENNKLLAEFLGWEKIKTSRNIGDKKDEFFTTPFFKEYYNTGTSIHREGWDTTNLLKSDELLFNTSWEWVMIVAERIETAETKDGRTFTIDMHRDSVLIFEYGLTTNEIVFTEGKGRLENLYNACIEFVKWWNEEQLS